MTIASSKNPLLKESRVDFSNFAPSLHTARKDLLDSSDLDLLVLEPVPRCRTAWVCNELHKQISTGCN